MGAQSYLPQVGGSFGDIIISALTRHRDRIAFKCEGRTWTYSECYDAIAGLRDRLQRAGVKPGDSIAQLTRNRPEQWLVMATAYIMGCKSVLLNAMAGADEHTYVLNDAEAVVVVVDGENAGRMDDYRAHTPLVNQWLCHDDSALGRGIWADIAPASAPLASLSEPEDVVRLAYTGGTTGKPKGVMLSNRSQIAAFMMSLADNDWPEDANLLIATPISHAAGSLILPVLFKGGTVHIHRRFQADVFLSAIEAERINIVHAVPTLLFKLMDHPDLRKFDLSSLKTILYGASPMPVSRILQAMDIFGPILSQGYGQTEAPASLTTLRKVDHTFRNGERLSSCGRPFPGIRIEILDDGSRPVASGEVGEICARGPVVMTGYWKQPELTREALKDGWLRTGDLGRMDDDGYLHIVGRKKDMLISGGFNIFPKEIEEILHRFHGVGAAAVFGLPDPEWGEIVAAVVQPVAGVALDKDELQAFVKSQKGSIGVPKRLWFVDAMPLTPNGKPDKKTLAAAYGAPAAAAEATSIIGTSNL